MDEGKSKKSGDTSRHGVVNKKKNVQEKKSKSETTTISSSSSLTEQSLENVVLVGRSCNIYKSKSFESGHGLHDCRSETAIFSLPDGQHPRENVPGEGVQPVPSNSSFFSALSSPSNCDVLQKKLMELEDKICTRNVGLCGFKTQFENQRELNEFSLRPTQTDETLMNIEDYILKLNEMEKKLLYKEKRIKDLNEKIEECNRARDLQIEENKGLAHQVSLLNRQLRSMYELLGTKNWNDPVDPNELTRYRSKVTELESVVKSQEENKKELWRKIDNISSTLETREIELNTKSRELIDYKNKSTLELCKLISQVDCLQKEAKSQSEILNTKILEAQNSMDDEIVNITLKLEDQYQKDIDSAVKKFQADFQRLGDLPRSAIEKLLQLCEPNKIDVIAFQKEWEKQQAALEAKIASMQSVHNKEVTQLKDTYESKILFLKTQVESLASQLTEKKGILDIFESELMTYKTNSSMNLLRASSRGDDIWSLKELYNAELFSQKQVHKLELDIFEEKVKTLSEEILFHAKSEEIHLQEVENAKKMAHAFREKYEQLVSEWKEKLENNPEEGPSEVIESPEERELDTMIKEFKSLIKFMRESEKTHEEKIIKLHADHEDALSSYKQDIESFKNKLHQLEKFQGVQTNLDKTIQDLIQNLGMNYSKTVEALLTSHITELNLKEMEIHSSEKRHSEELSSLKSAQEKDLQVLRNKLKQLEESKYLVERELEEVQSSIKENTCSEELAALTVRAEQISTELLKCEGMIAVKEETEQALTDRIEKLEDLLKLKEETCKKELQGVIAKFLEVKILSAAKDDLTKELEDKLDESEKLLEKSCEDVEKLHKLFTLLEENIMNIESCKLNDGGDTSNVDMESRFSMAKAKGEQIKTQLWDTLEKMKVLEGINQSKVEESEKLQGNLASVIEKSEVLEEEKKRISDENDKLKVENNKLAEEIKEIRFEKKKLEQVHEEQLKTKKKLEELEEENRKILEREKSLSADRDEVLERNEFLEENVRSLNERMELLLTELANNRGLEENEVLSISLQEIRVLYQEEHEIVSDAERNTSESTVGYNVESNARESFEDLWRVNEELKKENESLKMALRGKTIELKEFPMNESDASFHETVILKFRSLQDELSEVINERNSLLTISKSLEKERDFLKEEIENLKEENEEIRESCKAKIKFLSEKMVRASDQDSRAAEWKMGEMKKEIGKLSDHIKKLSSKVEVLKANNEILLSESHEYLKHNENLVTELEEAWTQRYEIEDQLAKVRKQNALLNLHRAQLEETNKRISNLMAEGKPSVVSWIKIHETVENIVDEVLALKTSFSDSGSGSGASLNVDVPKTTSEMKMMVEQLHTQLQNKTILCDELITQKETLEKELEGLEKLMRQNDSRILSKKALGSETMLTDDRKRQSEIQMNQSGSSLEEKRPALEIEISIEESKTSMKSPESSPIKTLSLLKKHMESQAELVDAQFRENLKLEIKGLEKEMQEQEENLNISKDVAQDEVRNLTLIELKYEEEVLELTKEFEREVDRLRMVFAQESDSESTRSLTEESREKYLQEIDKLKTYFEGKWADLEKRYKEIYSVEQQKKQLNSGVVNEQTRILSEYQKIFDEEDKEERKTKAESFLKEFLRRHSEELKSLRLRYEEDVSKLETNHISEVQRLKSVVLQMKENIEAALKKEEDEDKEKWQEEMRKEQEALVLSIRAEYEEKLERERKNYNDELEEAKEKHKREISALEEFWTEKLSECETKCAIMKATGDKKTEESFKRKSTEKSSTSSREQDHTEEVDQSGEKRFEKSHKEVQCYSEPISGLGLEEKKKPEESFCRSCLSSQTYFDRMEVKTDDDKLEILQERDALKEMVSSLRYIIAKLLSFVSQYRTDLNATVGECDETMYKSILVDMNQTDLSVASSRGLYALDLSSIIQEINDNSFLNSSDQVRFELDKCLKQLKKDATNLLALSCPESTARNLGDLIKKVEREKTLLEAKVSKVEEMQEEIKKEIGNTKDRLSQWERNLEVISEGYGEEIVEPNKVVSPPDLNDKIKLFLSDQQSEISLLDEICKEGDRLQEEWKKEKLDLQQQERCSDTECNGQIDVADKQVHSLKKFLEEQAAEREQERETFDKEINQLKESLKAKERDNLVQNRTNREEGHRSLMPWADASVEVLETQIKELTNRLEDVEKEKVSVDTEFQNAVKKIWSLREVIQELEVQLAEVSEKELGLKKRADKLDALLEEQSKVNRELKAELEACKNQEEIKHSELLKSLEEELMSLRRVAEQVNPEALLQLKSSLRDIEGILMRKTKDLEQLQVPSASVSCSSPSEDVSLRDQLDATRCSTPDEMCTNTESGNFILPLEEIDRVHEKLARHSRAEEMAMKCIRDLKMQARNNRKAFQEVQTERDVLLEKVDVYLKDNSSLKVRLEEQRCNAGLLQKQLNANLESQINRLEIDVEKLNKLCVEKDKQLKDMKEILENTTKALKVRETEAQNKSREENALIATLKTDLGNALNENQKLEESLDKVKEKLRDSLKMPALIDSMIDEKNEEIDRLEKEVVRLSGEISSLTDARKSSGSEPSKNVKRIKFSEPDSFGAYISSISDQNPSIMRNYNESYSEFRHSPFVIRQPFQCSTKLESVSSIGPLQLSPRGTDPSFNWKTSSPLVSNQDGVRSHLKPPSIKNESELQKMADESKLQSEIESKQREVSELHLEVDILKRQLVEMNEELTTARSQTKEIQNDLESKDEEVRQSKNIEKSLLLTIESLKQKHTEEVEELTSKLSFEHGKVEKVYEEIKALEVKKIEIEEAFLSLKEDYNEKLNGEQKTVEILIGQVKELELKNEKLASEKEEAERELYVMSEKLAKDISDLKEENESLKLMCEKLLKTSEEAQRQLEEKEKPCEVCQRNLVLELPAIGVESFKENLEELRAEFVRMGAVISERDFSKIEVFSYAMAVKRLLSYVLNSVDELHQELESHRKRVMECSVDDLAFKVQRELVLSAKLDNQLLSSIEANGFASKDPARSLESSFKEVGGGDSVLVVPKPQGNESLSKAAGMCKELVNKITRLENEKEVLEGKVAEQRRVVEMLEENLAKEKERLVQEKERCGEDAKIMELLRVNLEKGLQDMKSKEKDLKKEKHARMALEKEMEVLKKLKGNVPESKKLSDLNCQLEAQKEKLISLGRALEEEKKKSVELKLSLEKNKIERRSEKETQRLFENDLALLQEQKENLKTELINVRKTLNSRNVEIGLLKRQINLQEIDIKALSFPNDFNRQSTSETSSVVHKPGSLEDLSLIRLQRDFPTLNLREDMPSSLLNKMKKLNTCVQRHVKESNEMGETLLYLSQETEQMREMIKKLEEESDSKLMDKTLVADLDLERRLWALEKGGLVMNIETLKREQEILKRDLIETCKKNEILKLENSELKKSAKEEVPRDVENGFLQDRVSHLTRKYMRAESYRKALAWQKNYLLITIGDYRRSEEEAWKKIGRVGGGKKREGRKRGQKFGRFRVVALAVVAIFRMRFVVRRWHRHPNTLAPVGSQPLLTHRKLSPLTSVLNIYNEPINPLSYQTQNIIRSSSKVLRTPPSRDPGLEAYSLDSKKVSDCLEAFGYFKENVGSANALP